MSPSTPPRIFVSHSHQDNAFCREYVRGLREAGCDVWYDEHNLGWGVLRATIEREMPQREHFVAIFSPPAVASEWVNSEIDAAMELLRERTLRTLTFVLAAQCVIPLLLRRWKRVEQPGGVAVSADEAVSRTLAIIAPDLLQQHPKPSDEAHSPRLTETQMAAARLERVPAPPKPAKPSLPEVPARLASLGFRGINLDGAPAIVPPLCTVPAGPFRLGSDISHDQQANNNELQRRVVHLPVFEIARFPITVGEYACFVRTGYLAPQDWNVQLSKIDHPVVGVSWYDAQAYIDWLARKTGQNWRLPTEAEWEKAARSDLTTALFPGSERVYPWGNTFDPMRCTTGSSIWRGTSPVGWYGTRRPNESAYFERNNGASPCGAEDMAGNVWEWTASDFAGDYSKADIISLPDSITAKVLHGGSWSGLPMDARSACRIENRPDIAVQQYGFRIVYIPKP